MPEYAFHTVDVFTDRRFGGNPLAVFPDAAGLDTIAMQAIAREFNLSETTFVLPPDDPANTARVRIFTPTSELPFAGHPNVGTAFVLSALGRVPDGICRFEEEAGLVLVEVERSGADAPMGARVEAPRSLAIGLDLPTDLVAACLTLDEADLVTTAHDPLTAGTGVDAGFVEVTPDGLGRATPDIGAFRRARSVLPALEAPLSLAIYARDPADPARLRLRLFAPTLGIVEDPATGSAAATLAALLVSLAPGEDVALEFDITQGVEMGRPSRLRAGARKTAEGPVRAHVGGACVPVTRGTLTV